MGNTIIIINNIEAAHYVNEGDIVQFVVTPEYYKNFQNENAYRKIQRKIGSNNVDKKDLYICFPGNRRYSFIRPYSYSPLNNNDKRDFYYIYTNNPLTLVSIKNVNVKKENNILINIGHYQNLHFTLDNLTSSTNKFKTMPSSNFSLPLKNIMETSIDEYVFTFNENVKVILNGKEYKTGTPINKKTLESIQTNGDLLSITCDAEKDAVFLVCGRENSIFNGTWKTLDTWFYSPNMQQNNSDFYQTELHHMNSSHFIFENRIQEFYFSEQYIHDVKVLNKIYQNKFKKSLYSNEAYHFRDKYSVSCNAYSNIATNNFVVGKFNKGEKNTILFIDSRKPNSMIILRDMIPECAPFFNINNYYQDNLLDQKLPLADVFQSNQFSLDTKKFISTNGSKEYCLTFSNTVNVTIDGESYISGEVISENKFKEVEIRANLNKPSILTFCERDIQEGFGKFVGFDYNWTVKKVWFHE